jgi:hypothetical protein
MLPIKANSCGGFGAPGTGAVCPWAPNRSGHPTCRHGRLLEERQHKTTLKLAANYQLTCCINAVHSIRSGRVAAKRLGSPLKKGPVTGCHRPDDPASHSGRSGARASRGNRRSIAGLCHTPREGRSPRRSCKLRSSSQTGTNMKGTNLTTKVSSSQTGRSEKGERRRYDLKPHPSGYEREEDHLTGNSALNRRTSSPTGR